MKKPLDPLSFPGLVHIFFIMAGIIFWSGFVSGNQLAAASTQDDFLGCFANSGVWLRNSFDNSWNQLCAENANQICAGDVKGDGGDDLIGWWNTSGIWVRYTGAGNWEKILGPGQLIWLVAGDMNGDGRSDLLGSWSFGVWWRDSANGAWQKLHPTAATMLTSGDIDGDGKDDLIGAWNPEGIWARLANGQWQKMLGNEDLKFLNCADVNGDGREDLVGSWSHGVWWRDSVSGTWTKLFNMADKIACGDIDGDSKDDLIGLWPGVAGVWIRYTNGNWEKITDETATWLSAGKMSLTPHAIYYVSNSGNNANSGLSPAQAWATLTYAAGSSSPVVAGDKIYVKAGTYNEHVVFSKSGSAGKPIIFQGYMTNPGDTPPLMVAKANPYSNFLASDMPTFDGGNRANGIGFNCTNAKYLVIKNFQIQNFAYGVVAGGALQDAGNIVLDNVNAMSLGDIAASYSGEGILFGSMGTKFSNNNTLTNCLVVNSSAEGIGINGDNNSLTGCKVYCNENTNNNASTDYYVIVCGSRNTLTGCYIERTAGLYHNGHGFSLKSNAEQVVDQGSSLPVINPEYNKISYCVAKNMGESFCVRHRGVQNNSFYHCRAIGTHTGATGSPGGEGNCIVTRDGASNNTFDGCSAENCAAGFVFVDSVEDGDAGTNPPGHPGNGNKYLNCLIYNCYVGVSFSNYGVPSDAGDNTIANCTFYKTRYLHYAARHCANMKYFGNIYHGCLPNAPGGYFKGNTYAADIVPNGATTYFKNCDFINIEGGMPSGFVSGSPGSISADPLFVNPTLPDLHLKPASPCIDLSLALPFNPVDFDGISRPSGAAFDMGAYEYHLP